MHCVSTICERISGVSHRPEPACSIKHTCQTATPGMIESVEHQKPFEDRLLLPHTHADSCSAAVRVGSASCVLPWHWIPRPTTPRLASHFSWPNTALWHIHAVLVEAMLPMDAAQSGTIEYAHVPARPVHRSHTNQARYGPTRLSFSPRGVAGIYLNYNKNTAHLGL